MPTSENKKNVLIDDVNFVFAECVRMQTLLKEGRFKEMAQEHGFCDLPDPTPTEPRRKLICSRLGFRKLEELATLALDRGRLRRQVSLASARTTLGEILVRKFLRENRSLDIQNIERAFSETVTRCRSSLRRMTHFVPCQLMYVQSPAKFQIGRVSFLNRRKFRQTLASHIINNREVMRRGQRMIFDNARYFKAFGWVAEVTIDGCDKTVSPRVAEYAVLSALNCLHVLIGAGHTGKMIVGGPAVAKDHRGKFAIDGKDGLSYSTSYGGGGNVGFKDDWWEMVSEGRGREALACLGVALEAALDPSLNRPLSLRFLDAAQWFGEAVRESSAGAKVVKYVTAMERMVMTDEKDDITNLVSVRAAALCLDELTIQNRDKWRADVSRLYGIRSKLVHGSLSPTSELVGEGIQLGARISRHVLLSAVQGIGPAGLQDAAISNKKLGRWYDGLVGHCDRLIASAEGVNAAT